MHVVNAAGGKAGRHGGKKRRLSNAEAHFLSFHAAHALTQSGLFQQGISGLFRSKADSNAHNENDEHHGKNGLGFTAEQNLFSPCLFRFPFYGGGP